MKISFPAVIGKRYRLVWHARDVQSSKTFTVLANARADAIIAVSHFVKDQLVRKRVPQSKIKVIHNSIERIGALPASVPVQSQVSDYYEKRDGRIVFGNVGQFVPWKNQMVFLQAVEAAFAAGCEAEYLLIGDDLYGNEPIYKQSLLRKIEELQRRGCSIRWIGWLSRDSIWRHIDCLVHTAETEPFGRVIIEAMAAGVAVIATNSGGPAEIIRDGETGMLVSGKALTLGKAMMRLRNEPALRECLAERARADVTNCFTTDSTCLEIERLYEDLLGGGASSVPTGACSW
jgi:glycosyltransferase involved in cell wall biosynthesis